MNLIENLQVNIYYGSNGMKFGKFIKQNMLFRMTLRSFKVDVAFKAKFKSFIDPSLTMSLTLKATPDLDGLIVSFERAPFVF